jgi:ubiquitin related modifier 1
MASAPASGSTGLQTSAASKGLSLSIELSGGVELLFNNRKKFDITVPPPTAAAAAGSGPTLHDVVAYLRDVECSQRPELFSSGDGVRPGILVLINDVDYELEGGMDYRPVSGDRLTFISTLHGG